MIDVREVSAATVSRLRGIAALVEKLHGPEAIVDYDDAAPPYASRKDAVVNMPEPGALLFYEGFSLGSRGGVPSWGHKWSLVFRLSGVGSGEAGSLGYHELPAMILNAVPEGGDGLPFQYGTIHPGLDPPWNIGYRPMDDGAGTEVWVMEWTLMELSD